MLINQSDELMKIIERFAQSGWDVIDAPSKAWLNAKQSGEESEAVQNELIMAIKKADEECGNCGCEFDPLYKRAMLLLHGR